VDARLEGLRAATREIHERLHLHPAFAPIMSAQPDIVGYARLIAQLRGFHIPTETWLFTAAERLLPELTDLRQRRKAHLLQQDLVHLAAIPGVELSDPGAVESRSRLTRPALLGCLYVIEGATLGGRELGRKLAPTLQSAGLTGADGRQFFLAYGARQGDMWRRFCTVLADAAGTFTPSECRAMETAAHEQFLALENWLTGSLPSNTARAVPLDCAGALMPATQ
jgi:heme oxygenase (biliverdin-IX-beta and delta-forming)